MALKYIDKIGTKPKDTIDFKNVHEVGATVGSSFERDFYKTITYNGISYDIYTDDTDESILTIVKQYNLLWKNWLRTLGGQADWSLERL